MLWGKLETFGEWCVIFGKDEQPPSSEETG